jgi:hypothetical protein
LSATINRSAIGALGSDSGSLTSSTTVAHKFAEPGEYHGLVHIRGVATRSFTISVKAARQPAGDVGAAQLSKVDINLRALHMPMQAASSFELAAGGYAVFRVPAGAVGGYAVEVFSSAEKGPGPKVFDSRELGEEDLLATVLLRPGLYSVENAVDGAKAELTVLYPENTPKQPEPMKVKVSNGFTPSKIKLHPTQGLIFGFESASRIKISLVTPEDRPPRPRPHHAASRSGKKTTRQLRIMPRRRATKKSESSTR